MSGSVDCGKKYGRAFIFNSNGRTVKEDSGTFVATTSSLTMTMTKALS